MHYFSAFEWRSTSIKCPLACLIEAQSFPAMQTCLKRLNVFRRRTGLRSEIQLKCWCGCRREDSSASAHMGWVPYFCRAGAEILWTIVRSQWVCFHECRFDLHFEDFASKSSLKRRQVHWTSSELRQSLYTNQEEQLMRISADGNSFVESALTSRYLPQMSGPLHLPHVWAPSWSSIVNKSV